VPEDAQRGGDGPGRFELAGMALAIPDRQRMQGETVCTRDCSCRV
jgi:hypothetical protein